MELNEQIRWIPNSWDLCYLAMIITAVFEYIILAIRCLIVITMRPFFHCPDNLRKYRTIMNQCPSLCLVLFISVGWFLKFCFIKELHCLNFLKYVCNVKSDHVPSMNISIMFVLNNGQETNHSITDTCFCVGRFLLCDSSSMCYSPLYTTLSTPTHFSLCTWDIRVSYILWYGIVVSIHMHLIFLYSTWVLCVLLVVNMVFQFHL